MLNFLLGTLFRTSVRRNRFLFTILVCVHSAFYYKPSVALINPRKEFSVNIINLMMSSLEPSRGSPQTKRLVLIGGGHAHVQVIKAINSVTRPENVHVTLIDRQFSASYSGMVPGCISKLYTSDQVNIALDSLADWAGTEFIHGNVVGMTVPKCNETGNRLVHVEIIEESSKRLTTILVPFDVVSIDIGSTTRDFVTVPGASQFCISTRPISDLVRRIESWEDRLRDKLDTVAMTNNTRVVVVGGGAAGIELSLAMRARWNDYFPNVDLDNRESSSHLLITLINSNDELLPEESPECRNALKSILNKYQIEVRNKLLVNEVTSNHISVSCNTGKDTSDLFEEIPYTHCIWSTGAQAQELSWILNQQCGLSICSNRGWILVNEYLQSVSHPYIFAAGDCCEMIERKSPPKAGVYAVRSGPVLIRNLVHSLIENSNKEFELVKYHPQDDFLKLIMCGDGTALGFRFGIPLYGKWVWKLKSHIDLMFMDLFDVRKILEHSTDEKKNPIENYDESQYDSILVRPPPIMPDIAAELLTRTDDNVDYIMAWNVLREMTEVETYKRDVLRSVSRLISNRK